MILLDPTDALIPFTKHTPGITPFFIPAPAKDSCSSSSIFINLFKNWGISYYPIFHSCPMQLWLVLFISASTYQPPPPIQSIFFPFSLLLSFLSKLRICVCACKNLLSLSLVTLLLESFRNVPIVSVRL